MPEVSHPSDAVVEVLPVVWPATSGAARVKIVPIGRDDAGAFIFAKHRHSKRPVGYKFAIALRDDGGALHGVCVAGRPVARLLDTGLTLELTRVCSDGTPNACSMLMGAGRRAGVAMGYTKVITYSLASESGASLRAAGFRIEATLPARGSWAYHSKKRTDRDNEHGGVDRIRWCWP